MRILLTNDDGILAPGVEALYRAVAELGEIEVVAPETTQSASGHAITVRMPMLVQRLHVNNVFHGWSVDGRPADCVKLALLELLPQRPDFVLSGINAGANAGVNVLYSGTVAGAIEGAFFGVPSAAFSLEFSKELDFHRAGQIARRVFERFVASKPAPGSCINVNIPALDGGWPRGVRVCPQGAVPMDEHYQKQETVDGRVVYSLDGRFPEIDANGQCDQAALANRYVTITPLRCNMTDFEALERCAGVAWPKGFAD